MKIMKKEHTLLALCTMLLVAGSAWVIPNPQPIEEPTPIVAGGTGHYLYVATPGIRDYLGYGGHGLLVFDMDNNHKFVKRISTKGYHPDGTPSNVKGIAVSVQLNSVYISTWESVQRIDLETEELLWEIPYEGGCDRMAISPDGMTMYLPSLEKFTDKMVYLCPVNNCNSFPNKSHTRTVKSSEQVTTYLLFGENLAPCIIPV